MPLSRDSRQERKLKRLLRVQFGYKQFCERVDYDEDVVLPMLEALKAGKAIPELGLREGQAFDIVPELPSARPDPPKNTNSGE